MKFAVNSDEMKKIDDYSIHDFGIPALDLMEQAAKAVVAVMEKRMNKTDHILAVCGSGNNGGDGVAAGRILYLQGYHVAILFIGDENKVSDSMKVQLEMAKRIGIPMENRSKLSEYNIIIDSIFGVGLTRPVTGEYEEVINEINQGNHYVYSVDLPSGISANDGKVMQVAIKADETITFGHNKLGLILYPGAEYAGRLTIADTCFPQIATDQVEPEFQYYEPFDLGKLPKRKSNGHKGSFGKVLVIAGSEGMSGAAYLSAKAAYRTGAGLVKILTSKANRLILQTLLPEALFSAYDEDRLEEDRQFKLLQELDWATVIVVGPGLGLTATAEALLELVIGKAKVPLIIDADAITLLARKLKSIVDVKENHLFKGEETKIENQEKQGKGVEGRERWTALTSMLKENTILTPHLLELARLMGLSVSEVSDNLVDTGNQCSYNNKLIYAIKDARTLVVQESKRYINISGNNGMATGGSGDVLTGIIAALIAQGMKEYEAVCLGVYLHGLAGDVAAREKGVYSLMASDIIGSLEVVLKQASE
jgi:NAD(P)H-hydrate epimerase